jgi:hypothetical protein
MDNNGRRGTDDRGRSAVFNLIPRYYPLPPASALRNARISRTFARATFRISRLSYVRKPCLKLPLRSPRGPPEPFAPPCILHLERPLTAACLHG